MYSFRSRVRYSEVGENKKLTMFAIINYFQDCSTFQTEDVGLGLEELKRENRAWLLSSWQIEVLRYPRFGEEIEAGTIPYDFQGFYGMRNFFIKDSLGEIAVRANSVWVLINTKTGHPTRVPVEMADIYGLDPRMEMEYLDRKILLPEKEMFTAGEPFSVKNYHIDSNHHVNNSWYPAMAWEFLPKGFRCQKVQVEYKRAVAAGMEIYPFVAGENSVYWVMLADENRKPYAIIRAEEGETSD